MKRYTLLLMSVLALVLWVGRPASGFSQEPKKADNTEVNKRDRNQAEPTADQQKENRSDRDITQQIRKAITDDKSLSTDARNIKVITQNGSVTLKGPVRSEEEKKAIEDKAREIAGKNNVTSEIDIASKATSTGKKDY